jgi:predicted neutral ceramidase superfamily lipid hydrolase
MMQSFLDSVATGLYCYGIYCVLVWVVFGIYVLVFNSCEVKTLDEAIKRLNQLIEYHEVMAEQSRQMYKPYEEIRHRAKIEVLIVAVRNLRKGVTEFD